MKSLGDDYQNQEGKDSWVNIQDNIRGRYMVGLVKTVKI
jgi:hypothetical protein